MNIDYKSINRRHFLKTMAVGTLASAVLPSCDSLKNYMIEKMIGVDPEPQPGSIPMQSIVSPIRSTAAVVTDIQAIPKETTVNGEVVQRMLDEGMKAMVGKSNLEECWLSVFPNLKSSDVIGIKVNVSGKEFFTHPEVIDAVINSLKKIGVADNNIIVWDRSDDMWGEGLITCGFGINTSKNGVRYVATNIDSVGYDSDTVAHLKSANIDFPLTKIITQLCDYMINIPILKAGTGYCGITGCMKNYYGAIPLFDYSPRKGIKEVHANNCNPQIAELYNHPLIRDKTILNIYDALLGKFEGGPSGPPQFVKNQLILGTDPVAVDYLGLMVVEQERSKRGLSSLFPYTKYIQTAAEMGLGTNHPKQIDLKEITLT